MIIALGRELGAGGRDVGECVAAALGAELLDKQIVDLVAARIGAPQSLVEARDERVEGFVERLFESITAAQPEAYAEVPDWSEERLVRLTEAIIRERAQDKSLVVIGRGAPVLLRDRSDALRVFVTAPFENRVERLRLRLGCAHEEAARMVRKSDQHRAAYMQHHYGVDWRDAHNYDLIVNTQRLRTDGAALLIIEASERFSK